MENHSPIPAGAKLLTLDEVARELKVSRRFLEVQAARGRLRRVRLSARCIRIRRADLNAYIDSSSNPAACNER